MKSKEIDAKFVSQFIETCTQKGISTTEDICNEVKQKIAEIDEQVKYRNKLQDVLAAFGDKVVVSEQNSPAPPQNINTRFAIEILEIIGGRKTSISELMKVIGGFSDDHKKDLIFTVKCMIENDVLTRDQDGSIIAGNKYAQFFAE